MVVGGEVVGQEEEQVGVWTGNTICSGLRGILWMGRLLQTNHQTDLHSHAVCGWSVSGHPEGVGDGGLLPFSLPCPPTRMEFLLCRRAEINWGSFGVPFVVPLLRSVNRWREWGCLT